ncbi:hypothetical protein Tco_0123346 [Tanacetum coccineum]
MTRSSFHMLLVQMVQQMLHSGRAYENQFAGSGGRAGKAAIPPGGPVNLRLAHLTVSMRLHWANYLGELVRELSLHHPSWRQMPPEQKAGVMARIGHPNVTIPLLPDFGGVKGMIPRTVPGSATREYPSLIHTFFLTHTVNGVLLNPEDKARYEMLRLQGLGSNTEMGVPYTEDEIMAIVRGGKQREHIPGVGKVLPGQRTIIPPSPPCTHSSDVAKLKKREKVLTRQVNMFMKLFRSDDKFSQMLSQLESQPEIGGGSESGGCGDDEQGDDEDDGEYGEDEDDN